MEELVKLVEEIATQQDTNTELIIEMNDEITSLNDKFNLLNTSPNNQFISKTSDEITTLNVKLSGLIDKVNKLEKKCWFQVGDRVSFISNDGFYIYEIKSAVIRSVIDSETVFIEETTDWYLLDLFKNRRRLTVKTKDIKLR